MTVFELEDYIRLCLEKQPVLGEHYVRRQIEWAQAEIERFDEISGGARAAQPSGAQASAAGAFSAVCASSKFSSGGVVAPQIGLIHETHAGKSHG